MSTREIGTMGEAFAARVLCEKGQSLLARNFYTPYGELDLVMKDGACIAFVEVKARKEGSMVAPAEAVGPVKQKRMVLSAIKYLSDNPTDGQPRFDVFEIVLQKGKKFAVQSYRYIINAFEVENYESI